MRFWEHVYTSIPVPGSDRKGLDLPPPKMDFSPFPSLGESFLKTTSKWVRIPRLIEDHRETR